MAMVAKHVVMSGRGVFKVPDDVLCPGQIGRFHQPDFRIGMGEGYFAQGTLGVFIHDAGFNPRFGQQALQQVGLLQVFGGKQFEHGRGSVFKADTHFQFDLVMGDLAVLQMATGFQYLKPIHMAQGFCRTADGIADGVIGAGSGRADQFNHLVGVV